ncbi:MAG: hypothetical protein IT162_15215 [Bryobacterales bacterium]|nr:hypothetical protein [Bryobacterales bacterium]
MKLPGLMMLWIGFSLSPAQAGPRLIFEVQGFMRYRAGLVGSDYNLYVNVEPTSVRGVDTVLHNGVTRNFFPGGRFLFGAGPIAPGVGWSNDPTAWQFWQFNLHGLNEVRMLGGLDMDNDGLSDARDIAPNSNIFGGEFAAPVWVFTDAGCCYDLVGSFLGSPNSQLISFYGFNNDYGWRGRLTLHHSGLGVLPPDAFELHGSVGFVELEYVPEPQAVWLLLLPSALVALKLARRLA